MIEFIDPSTVSIPIDVLSLIPGDFARRHHVIPVALRGSRLILATATPEDRYALEEVMFMTDRMVGLAICSDPQMAAALELHYPVIVPR